MTYSHRRRSSRWLNLVPWPVGHRDNSETEIDTLTPLLEFLQPASPPVGLLANIEAKIDKLESDNVKARPNRSRRILGRRDFVAGLSGAMVSAAAVGVIVLVGPRNSYNLAVPTRLATLVGPETTRVLIADTIEEGRYLRLQHSGPPSDPKRAFELWVVPGGDGPPKSLGLLADSGSITVLPLEITIAPGDILALSDEPAGGSPTGSPTGPVQISAIVGLAG